MLFFRSNPKYKIDVRVNGRLVFASVQEASIKMDESGTTIFIPELQPFKPFFTPMDIAPGEHLPPANKTRKVKNA